MFKARWKHDIEVQLTCRIGENLKGVIDKEEDGLFVQTQYGF